MRHLMVFLDRETLNASLRAPNFPHSYQEYDASSGDQILERLRDATIAIVNKVTITALRIFM